MGSQSCRPIANLLAQHVIYERVCFAVWVLIMPLFHAYPWQKLVGASATVAHTAPCCLALHKLAPIAV